MNYELKDFYTKSNLLSFVRFLMFIPVIYLFEYYETDYNIRFYLVALYLFAAVTDLLDGYLARKFNEITELGKVIDPLADKAMVIAIVLMMYSKGFLSDIYFYTIILRDVIIFLGGIYVTKRIGKVLPSNLLGKITVTSIGFYLIFATLNLESLTLFNNLFYFLSLIMSYLSLVGYGIRAKEAIQWSKNETL